ncbi:2-phosphoxylose phosphatase 1-like isoform X1 [Coregonus clupeaformis]|uniref:2-phosphoxylose phosphatase 1-like isoform X1 n=1 Tax=Coregonus clupeaformis TaxID=59861 RepID=UPI001BDFAFE1|nr:2-phosphoxylose phosphatase 1-like isoform X1 [Coregonus clupeaformis]
MLARNRFILLVVVGAVLAIVSLSLQFLHLIPTTPMGEERPPKGQGQGQGKSRKRVIPVLHTEPPEPDPISEANGYCNTPNRSDQAWEGHSPVDYMLLSVQVMIRHGDRYPLYAIPKTKRPAIDCTLFPKRKPSHPQLKSFIGHMAQGGRGQWEGTLSSLPRLPNHNACEMGELTQTGVVQHLRNGQLLRQAYKRHKLLPPDWSTKQVWVETTGRSRTLQSGMALLYGFLPDFDWSRLTVHHQWSTLFCGSACDCPARNRYLEEEQRRQYRLRVADTELERTYADMARTLGLPPRQLRAANPIDSLLCHLCHGLSFPCVPAGSAIGSGGCLTLAQFAVIRRQQLEDEVDRRRVGLYRRYALLATHPYLNRTANRMERVAKANAPGRKPRAGGEEVFTLSSAHDVTVAPLLSALGLEEALFPRFAARVVFELWKSPPATQGQRKGQGQGQDKAARVKGERSKGGNGGDMFVRVLYNGEDVTFHTTFCRSHDHHATQPLCPLGNFLSFVRKDMFSVLNATSYHDACYRQTG